MSQNALALEISVIIPARNCPEQLKKSLGSLRKSGYLHYEIIVVDDASSDDTPQVAEEFGARVERLTEQSGPAQARNRGSEVATGDILLFIDADVCVQPRTLVQFAELFSRDETVAAAFGSYDDRPKAGNIVSQYRNLLHHFVHQRGRRESSTFWAGCGAVRRDVFDNVGGFDTGYRRPCIEDIELGVRLRKQGLRIVLDSDIQVTHLKHWTFAGMLKADIFDRALPWTSLILNEADCPNDLNLKQTQRICVALTGILCVLFLAACYLSPVLLLLPLGTMMFIAAVDHWSIRRRVPTLLRLVAAALGLAICGWLAVTFEYWSIIPLVIVLAVLLMNLPFYLFIARARGPLFACLAIPLQLLFHLYCGGAFAWGLIHHMAGKLSKSNSKTLRSNDCATSLRT